jgi:hypothetical protein
MFQCEYDCGFRGPFDLVCTHEETCPLRNEQGEEDDNEEEEEEGSGGEERDGVVDDGRVDGGCGGMGALSRASVVGASACCWSGTRVQRGCFDTVLMNPPFGTRCKGIDMLFLYTGAYRVSSKTNRWSELCVYVMCDSCTWTNRCDTHCLHVRWSAPVHEGPVCCCVSMRNRYAWHARVDMQSTCCVCHEEEWACPSPISLAYFGTRCPLAWRVYVCMCVCAGVRACKRALVHACVRGYAWRAFDVARAMLLE